MSGQAGEDDIAGVMLDEMTTVNNEGFISDSATWPPAAG